MATRTYLFFSLSKCLLVVVGCIIGAASVCIIFADGVFLYEDSAGS